MEVLWPENRDGICQLVHIMGTPLFAYHFLQSSDISSTHYVPLQSTCFSKIIMFLPVLIPRFHYGIWYMLYYAVFPVKFYVCMYFHDTSIKTSKLKFKAKQKQTGKNIWKGINPLTSLLWVLFVKNISFDLALWGKSTGDLFYKTIKEFWNCHLCFYKGL